MSSEIYFSYLRLRGTPDVKDEMDDMRVEHEAIKSLPHVSFKDMIVNPALRSPLIIGKKHTLKNMTSLFAATFEEVSTNYFNYYPRSVILRIFCNN